MGQKYLNEEAQITYSNILEEAKSEAKCEDLNDETNLREFIKLLKTFFSASTDDDRRHILRVKAQKSLELLNIMTVRRN